MTANVWYATSSLFFRLLLLLFQVSVYFNIFFHISFGIRGTVNAWTDCGKWNQSSLRLIKLKELKRAKQKSVWIYWNLRYNAFCVIGSCFWNVIGSVFIHASFVVISHTNLSVIFVSFRNDKLQSYKSDADQFSKFVWILGIKTKLNAWFVAHFLDITQEN